MVTALHTHSVGVIGTDPKGSKRERLYLYNKFIMSTTLWELLTNSHF